MRRIKLIPPVVAAVATMLVWSASAMAQDFSIEDPINCTGFCAFDNFSGDDDNNFFDAGAGQGVILGSGSVGDVELSGRSTTLS
jgi:hypothetical protein